MGHMTYFEKKAESAKKSIMAAIYTWSKKGQWIFSNPSIIVFHIQKSKWLYIDVHTGPNSAPRDHTEW